MQELTVGVDVGTTSVKAVAADAEGNVIARARIHHEVRIPAADQLEHDAKSAWHDGPKAALAALGDAVLKDSKVAGVCVGGMVPSLAAVDKSGIPIGPGLLYGDARGSTGSFSSPAGNGEQVQFLRWLKNSTPNAAGFWPVQAVANYALGGVAAIDTMTAVTGMPLFEGAGWSPDVAAELGITLDQLPVIHDWAASVGEVPAAGGAVLASGTIDAMAETAVAGADANGDVLVICGTTLMTWSVIDDWLEYPGYFTIPHMNAGKMLVGGPSNAGGLFLNWASRMLAEGGEATDPMRVPIWVPYPRGERVPIHDPNRRASLHDLDLTHDAAAVRHAAFEAAGFIVRRTIEGCEVPTPRRIVATGGGVNLSDWIQSLADCTGLPVDIVGTPEGGALGAAFVARLAAGLETDSGAGGRWAKVARTVEPRKEWLDPVEDRYRRFCELAK